MERIDKQQARQNGQQQNTSQEATPKYPTFEQTDQTQAEQVLAARQADEQPEAESQLVTLPATEPPQSKPPQASPSPKGQQRYGIRILVAVMIVLLLICFSASVLLVQAQSPWYFAAIPLIVLLPVLYGLIRLGYSFASTGFQRKTLWDWLHLFGIVAIPVVVTLASFFFSGLQNHDLQITQQQYQDNRTISLDQQEQTTLSTYLDGMTNLLLNDNLRKAKPGDTVLALARARTLTALHILNSTRKGILLTFLSEAGLIEKDGSIIDLSNADLSSADLRNAVLLDADLSNADLSNANLSGTKLGNADLSNANLSGTKLGSADLSNANLSGANLSGAILSNADLSGALLISTKLGSADLSSADLSGATLSGAILSNANLSGADLSGADLRGAKVTNKQLAVTKSLRDAIMPNGIKHP